MPHRITAHERLELLQEMDAMRAHLTFYLTAKVGYMHEVPWSIVQISHMDRAIAEAALRRLLVSGHKHPMMRLGLMLH